MKKQIVTILFVALAALPRVFAGGGNETPPALTAVELMAGYQSAAAAGVLVQWKTEGEELHISMSATTTGWVAVGFNPTRQMKDANIIIGYVAGGEVHLRDDYGTGNIRHDPDTANGGVSNLSNVKGTETNGVTTISFTIPLDSGDSWDRPLEKGKSYRAIVAHGSNGDDDFGSYHGERGSLEIAL